MQNSKDAAEYIQHLKCDKSLAILVKNKKLIYQLKCNEMQLEIQLNQAI